MDSMISTLRLPCRAPYDWAATLGFLARRAIDGVESVEGGVYRRAIRCKDLTGTVEIAHDEAGEALAATLGLIPAGAEGSVAERLRRMFDLDADLRTIAAHLARDPAMAPLVAARPWLRVPGGWDAFEVAARSVIGQQVTVARAQRLNSILVDRCGTELPGHAGRGLRRTFPTAGQVLDADLSGMGMPGARVATLKAIAEAALADPRLFERSDSIEKTVVRLRGIRGIGDWTAHYIAMRACREPDAFPAGDVGLLRGAADATGRRPLPAELLARAEVWRPWRAYAAHHLWALDGAGGVFDSGARGGVSCASAGVTVGET